MTVGSGLVFSGEIQVNIRHLSAAKSQKSLKGDIMDDPDTMSLFTSSKVLGFENDEILGPTGAVAIPEFNTKFTRQMLIDTQPKDFNTLVRLSGFSHGTDAASLLFQISWILRFTASRPAQQYSASNALARMEKKVA